MASMVSQTLISLALLLGLFGLARPDFASDRAECADKLIGMATCLTYVQDQAAAPTPDCCSGLKQVLQASKKCLCVLIKDRDDPNLGFKVNITKALGLPTLCNAPANISDCPKLLNLPPNSKDAQIFEQYGKQSGAPSQSGGSSNGKGASAASAGTPKTGLGAGKKWLLGVEKVGGATCTIFYLISLLVSFFLLG